MRAKGLTLLEVVLALGVLAVVLLAFTGLQVTSLRAGSSGRLTQKAVREAENFLESLRTNPGSLPSRCLSSFTLSGLSAACAYQPCRADGTGLACGPSVTQPTAYRVTLRVPGDTPRLTLETVVYAP
jgi:Tfp pilus assembly protein PilV